MAIADQSKWRYVLTDISGTPIGPVLNASLKQWTKTLNAGRTAQFTVNIDNPIADAVLSEDTLLKVYRKQRVSGEYKLLLNGDVIQAEESAQGDTGLITVVAADPYWRLQRRRCGIEMDSNGQGVGYTDGTEQLTQASNSAILGSGTTQTAANIAAHGLQVINGGGFFTGATPGAAPYNPGGFLQVYNTTNISAGVSGLTPTFYWAYTGLTLNSDGTATFTGVTEAPFGNGTPLGDVHDSWIVGGQVSYPELLADLLAYLNDGGSWMGSTAFNTGLELGTVVDSPNLGYVGPVYMQNIGDLIQQICTTLGGPDFDIIPQEPVNEMPNTIIGALNIYGNQVGSARTNCIFEYGCGQHNVATYDRILTKDGLANTIYSPPQGFPGTTALGDTMVSASDSTSKNAIGLYQDEVNNDVTSIPLRQELCNEYVAIRKYARQQITFTPTVDCPLDFGVDFDVGDTVGARAFVDGSYRYNGSVRVYGVTFNVDDNDAETPSLLLIPQIG